MEEWRRMQSSFSPNIKELLLSGPRFGDIVPKRGSWKRRNLNPFKNYGKRRESRTVLCPDF
jgi:hypothetical protein